MVRKWSYRLSLMIPVLFSSINGLAAQPDGETLLKDNLEAVVAQTGVQYTRSEVYKGSAGTPGGRLLGSTELVDGISGKALRLKGQSTVVYAPAEGKIDPLGGQLSFAVAFNFDPMEKNQRTRTVLRNQILLTVQSPPGRSNVCIYNAGSDIFAVAVENADGTIVFSRSFRKVFKPGQWHRIALTWGREMELWCDGEKQASGPWEGLFGSIPANLKEGRLLLGAVAGCGVENEFSIDELTITGPTATRITTRPRISLPLLSEPVTLDGSLNEPFWKKASRVTGFVSFQKNVLAAHPAVIYAAYTREGIYLGLEATLPAGTFPRATLTARDSAVYGEDGLEIHVHPAGDASVYQFIASALGTRFDHKVKAGQYRGDIGGYQPDWQVKTKTARGGWTAEMFIPFSAFDGSPAPKPGDVWQANFCRISNDGTTSAATWSYVNAHSYILPTYFGELVFAGKERTLRETRLSGFDAGEPQIDLELVGDYKPIITATCEVFDATAARIYNNRILIKDATAISFKLPTVMTGDYLVMLSGVDELGQTVFRQPFGFRTDKSFDFSAANYPYAGYIKFQATVKNSREPFGKVLVTITGPDKKTVGTAAITELNQGVGLCRFANDHLKPGIYTAEAALYSRGGKVLETAKQTIRIFEKPEWWKNNLGIDHSVPPPFEPVKDQGETLSAWGRDHVLGKGSFPLQVTSQKKKLFANAPTFTLKADGVTVDLAAMTARPGRSFPDAVSRTAAATAGTLAIQSKATLEFDGLLRYDLSLTPASSATIQELTLQIALPKDLAKFLLTSTGWTSSITPVEKDYSSPFVPYVWLGNDDMGFSWFAEKDQYWNPPNGKAIQVLPAADKVIFRVNFITQPVVIRQPITLTFGFQATPLRPIPQNDPYAYPMYRELGNISFAESLTYPQTGHIRPEQGTFEFWIKRHGNPGDKRNMQIFQIGGQKRPITAYLLSPSDPDTLWIYQGQTRIIGGKIPFAKDSFTHIALTWNATSVALYADGQRVAEAAGPAVGALKEALAEKDGRIILGAFDDKYGYTAITLDEIRISDTVRYSGQSFAVTNQPFAADSHTLLLDPLDETFTPDGQDTETNAGGIPSIGGRFVPAKFDRGLRLHVGLPEPALEVMKRLGTNVVNEWFWVKDIVDFCGQPYLHAPLWKDFPKNLKGYRQYGFNVNPYMAYPAIVNVSGLIEPYGAEWMVKPLSTMLWNYPGTPEGYYYLNSCQGARGFSDYFAAYLVWTLNLGFDGFYTDGLTSVYACQNQDHGCGYLDGEGNLHSTYPILATRETLKRMYRITKAKNPRGLVVNHASFNMLTPTMAFSDIVYTGEHEDYENLLTGRLRFNSTPWGLYTTTIGSSEHEYSPVHTMACLLSGSSVWGGGMIGRKDLARKESAIRSVYRAFDTRSAVWVPWFKGENGYYHVDDPRIKVSQYYHSGRGILLVAANFNPEAKTARIHLDLAKSGLAGKSLKAINALTNQPVDLTTDGCLTVIIKPKSFRLIRIEP